MAHKSWNRLYFITQQTLFSMLYNNVRISLYYTSLIWPELRDERNPWKACPVVGLWELKGHVIKRILRSLLI